MNKQTAAQSLQTRSGWCPPVRREDYDSSAFLTLDEEKALAELLSSHRRWGNEHISSAEQAGTPDYAPA